jgi:uncharacterized protein (TIGR03382 family)
MEPRIRFRAWGGAALMLALVSVASPALAGTGDDRTGDLRPEAAAVLDAAATHGGPFTLDDARAIGAAPPRHSLAPGALAFDMPATIRVWRRGIDGSTASCSGRVDVIPLEKYVKGVLPHEWIRSWDDESLKAGSVAIRTYAAWWVNAGGKYSCADLDDTTASQVYKDEFFANTDAATDATNAQVVVKDGDLVFAEYSAENSDPTEFGVDEPLCAGHARNGHGRGTCQWGTQRWALDGRSYDWMMRHYYPGADVQGIAPVWGASLTGQEVQTQLQSGDEIVVWVEYTNDGNTTWDPASVLVGTSGPRDRESPFFKDGNWVSPTRPTGADHSQQGPGSTARFTWAMVAPEVAETTTFVESFALVTSDGTWFGPADVTWEITVSPRGTSGDPGEDPPPTGGDDQDPVGDDGGGCNSGGGGGALIPLLIAVAILVLRRRADFRPALLAAGSALLLANMLGACTPDAPSPRARSTEPTLGGDSALVRTFEQIGEARGIPPALLATVSYVETRLRFVGGYDAEHGPGAVGLLALRPELIAHAAELAGLDETLVHTDDDASIDAAAALLVELRGDADWRDALVAYGGRELADDVDRAMKRGWTGRDLTGAEITVSAPRAVTKEPGYGTTVQALGYPGAIWNAAYSGNYQASSRGAAEINYVVIHTTQGSYGGTINWFKNPAAEVSAHYVVRSSDGEVTQMVDDSDVAWHDACFNSQTIGIEHEGFVADPEVWYTEAMYTESAKLTAWLADQYGIPKDRDHIFGHGEAPDCSDHTDPGSGWNWAHYMDLVVTGGQPQYGAAGGAAAFPATMVSGEEAVVWFEFENQSNVVWGLDDTRLGTQEPQDRESPFFVEGNWLAPNRPTGADHSNYGPGAVGRFTFAIKAPEVSETTTYDEAFQLVQEGVTWFGPVVRMQITVQPRDGADPGDDDGTIGDGPDGNDDGAGEGEHGGCSAGGDGAGVCAILVLGALITLRRRERR